VNAARVLIVEDDPEQAQSLAAVLALSGLDCEIAGTLRLALDRLAGGHLGCAILDLTLPDATGLVGVTALVAAFPLVPVVVLTGAADYAAEALRAGAQEVVLKPADPEALARSVRYAVERHKVRSAYRPYQEALESAVGKLDELAGKAPPPGGGPSC
jgi:DNA-binding NtrC family response regulator